jgi:hypothetical protein
MILTVSSASKLMTTIMIDPTTFSALSQAVNASFRGVIVLGEFTQGTCPVQYLASMVA